MQNTPGSRPSAPTHSREAVLLSRWHPFLSSDYDYERAKTAMESIRAARMAADARLVQAGRDPVQVIGSVFDKHDSALHAAVAINLGSFLAECERLVEDLDAL